MKRTTILFTIIFSTLSFSGVIAKEKINKKRDRLRFGYGKVVSTDVYEVGPNGEPYHVSTDVLCELQGSMRCRAGSAAFPDPQNELDIFDEQYTSAEKAVAEEVLENGEWQIEIGMESGSVREVMQFVNTENDQSYYRIFTYTWYTDYDESIHSSLDVSDPYELTQLNSN